MRETKKRIVSLLLCLCLALCPFVQPSAGAESSVCFIAINDDTLLELTYMPFSHGSTTYVPYWVFTDYGFGINFTYFEEGSTAMLYSGSAGKQVFFELTSGNTYDAYGNYYSTQAIIRNGEVYLPVSFMCSYFGTASYSYITGSSYGDILRIKSGSVVLSDIQFQRAAASLMKSRYDAYMGNTVAPTPEVTPAEPVTEPPEEPGGSVSLCFTGLPTDSIMDALDKEKAKAMFFLTAQDVLADPDMVRRIYCGGHGIGVLLTENAQDDFERTSELLYDAARVKTVQAAVGVNAEALTQDAEALGLIVYSPDIDATLAESVNSVYAVTSELDVRDGSSIVFMRCGGEAEKMLPILLRYIKSNDCSLFVPRETGG